MIPSTIICVQGNHEVPFKEMHGNGLPDYNSNLVNFDKYLNEFKI